MGIGIARYYAYDNTTNYQGYWASAVSPPHENATNVKDCGCCIVKETYYTYHYFCKNHMSEYREHNISIKRKAPSI